MGVFWCVLILFCDVFWFTARSRKKRRELEGDEAAMQKFLMREDFVSRLQLAMMLVSVTAILTKLAGCVQV